MIEQTIRHYIKVGVHFLSIQQLNSLQKDIDQLIKDRADQLLEEQYAGTLVLDGDRHFHRKEVTG